MSHDIFNAMAQNSVYHIVMNYQMEVCLHRSHTGCISTKYMMSLFTFLQRFYIATGEGDADAVNGNLSLNRCLASVLESLKKKWGGKKNS